MQTPSISATVKIFLGGMMLFNGLIGWMVYKQISIASFPTTTATVVSKDVIAQRSTSSSTRLQQLYCPEVRFAYQVAGQDYQSDSYRYGGYCASDWQDADHVATLYTPGDDVLAYFNPEDPQEAYLTAGIGPLEHLSLLFFLPFNIFFLGWILEITSLKLRGRKIEPAVFIFGTEGQRAWAQFPRIGPVKFTLGVLLVVGFLQSIGLMFFFRSISASAFKYLWLMLGGLALGSIIGKGLWNRYHTYRVTIEQDHLVLQDGTRIPGYQIEHLDIRPAGKSEGEKAFQSLNLHYRAGDQSHRIRFPNVLTRAEASRFYEWLWNHL